MAYHDDKHESDPSADTAVSEGHLREVVEREAEHAARKAEGIQTEVTQHVSQNAGRSVIGFPKSCADIQQGIAVEVVQKEDAQSGEDSENYHYYFGESGVDYAHERDHRYHHSAYYEQGPSPGSEAVKEALVAGGVDSIHYHCEAEVDDTDR